MTSPEIVESEKPFYGDQPTVKQTILRKRYDRYLEVLNGFPCFAARASAMHRNVNTCSGL